MKVLHQARVGHVIDYQDNVITFSFFLGGAQATGSARGVSFRLRGGYLYPSRA